MDDLSERLSNIQAANSDAAVLIKADEDIRYGRVVEILDAARSAGLSRLGMATKPAE